MSLQSRRQYLKNMGKGVLVTPFLSNPFKIEKATYPPYPDISDGILERDGWIISDQWQEDWDNAYVSAIELEWEWLQELVREETDGLVDLPLGGMLLLRIGNDARTYQVNGDTRWNGETFVSTSLSKFLLREEIRGAFRDYLDDFTVGEFENVGKISWKFGSIFPTSASVISGMCMEGGSLNTELEGSVQLNQHNLEYELTEDSANINGSTELATTGSLNCYGWNRAIASNGHIYVLTAVHPRATDEYCGLGDSPFEDTLAEVTGRDVTLNLDTSLTGRVRTVLGAVR